MLSQGGPGVCQYTRLFLRSQELIVLFPVPHTLVSCTDYENQVLGGFYTIMTLLTFNLTWKQLQACPGVSQLCILLET